MDAEQIKNASYGDDQEGSIVGDFFSRYLPYWPLFLVFLTVSLAGAWIYLRLATPIYQSAATILVKDEKNGAGDQSKLLESLNLFGSKKVVENEIEVIRSRTMAREVANKLHLYINVFQKTRISEKDAYMVSPVNIEALYPDSMQRNVNIPFVFKDSNLVILGKDSFLLNTWAKTPYGQLRFTKNKYYQDKPIVGLSFSTMPLKDATTALLQDLSISSASKMSSVINLTYKDIIPTRGEDVLNELISSYNSAAINDKNKLAGNTLRFVEQRLGLLVGELDSVEHSLERFRRQNKIVDISEQGKVFLANVGANDQKVGEMNMQLAVLNRVEEYVTSKNNEGGIVPSTLGVTDPVLTNLLQGLYELELEYQKQKSTTGENNPVVMTIDDQIKKVKPGILENIRNQKRALLAGRDDVSGTNNKYNTLLETLPQKERQLLDISRQQSIKNSIYTFLLEKREETALSYASTVADSRVIDNAETGRLPVSPKGAIVWLTAVILALIIPIILIEIKEMMNRNVMQRSEIEKYTSTPIIGEIVHEKAEGAVVISEGVRSVIAEQFRQLRTSLGYLGINSRKKKIAVTSSISGEGKSFISANLGISLALMGKKTVLVELDIRKPRLSKIFNVSSPKGVSGFLMDETMEAEDIIVPLTSHANLFIIPSGPIPFNPSELIMNGRLEVLLKYLELHFDYILIDTSPIGPVTDAYIISPLCDATLYVIRHGVTPRSWLHKIEEHTKIRPLKNMAIIFNDIKMRGFSKYGNYEYQRAYDSSYAESPKQASRRAKEEKAAQENK